MADERVETGGPEAPPAGEAIHLPGPSYLPAVAAAGISMAVVGVVILWVLIVIGVVIAGVAIWRWIRETREAIAELPLQHH
jgi:uncharacterized membrane protein YidH (DUF202 family)